MYVYLGKPSLKGLVFKVIRKEIVGKDFIKFANIC